MGQDDEDAGGNARQDDEDTREEARQDDEDARENTWLDDLGARDDERDQPDERNPEDAGRDPAGVDEQEPDHPRDHPFPAHVLRDETAGAGRRREPGRFLDGFVAGLALLALVWATFSLVDDEPEARDVTSSEERSDRRGSGTLSAASGSPAPPTRLERCADSASALSAPLAAVRPAMDQWEVHIGAMNKLVTGAITLAQASAFWNQTRMGAQRRIAAFDRALAEQRRQGVDCPPPARLQKATPRLRACARQVAADVTALEKARISIAMWDHHVRDMDMLRMGMLTPEDATQMWLTMWRQGVRELEDYRSAARAVGPSGGC